MFLKNFHLSQAITTLLHTLISIAIGAVVTGLAAIIQVINSPSPVNVKATLALGLTGAVTYFFTNIRVLVSSPNTLQAEADLFKGGQEAFNALNTQISQLISSHQDLKVLVSSIAAQSNANAVVNNAAPAQQQFQKPLAAIPQEASFTNPWIAAQQTTPTGVAPVTPNP